MIRWADRRDPALHRVGVADIEQLDRRFGREAVREPEQPLHGEPHEANRLHTAAGIRWIDFEDACRGPIEWDLAFLPERSLAAFGQVDRELLDLLGTLNAAVAGSVLLYEVIRQRR